MSFTTEEFLSFLDQQSVKTECSYCGSNKWIPGVEVEPNVYPTLGTMEADGNITPARVVPVVTMTCSKCFGMRSFSRLMLEQELGKKTQNEA